MASFSYPAALAALTVGGAAAAYGLELQPNSLRSQFMDFMHSVPSDVDIDQFSHEIIPTALRRSLASVRLASGVASMPNSSLQDAERVQATISRVEKQASAHFEANKTKIAEVSVLLVSLTRRVDILEAEVHTLTIEVKANGNGLKDVATEVEGQGEQIEELRQELHKEIEARKLDTKRGESKDSADNTSNLVESKIHALKIQLERKKELVQAAEVERPHIQAALEKARREVDFHENNLRANTQDREVASQCAEKIEAQLATLLSL